MSSIILYMVKEVVDRKRLYVSRSQLIFVFRILLTIHFIQPEVARIYNGHSSHVLGVRFTARGDYLLSVGGEDLTTLQWKVVA